MIAEIRTQIDLTRKVTSKDHLRRILMLLLDARAAWSEPGQQAKAERLEREARAMLGSTGQAKVA
jgi:hypothetical protein